MFFTQPAMTTLEVRAAAAMKYLRLMQDRAEKKLRLNQARDRAVRMKKCRPAMEAQVASMIEERHAAERLTL